MTTGNSQREEPDLSAVLGEAAEDLTARVLERARRLVEMESPTGDVARAGVLAAELEAAFAELGAEVEQLEAPGLGIHVRARVADARQDQAPLLVLGHLDTVHPVGSIRERPFRVEDDRAYGPGIFDMKAPLAVLLETLAIIGKSGSRQTRPVEVLITCDEEAGSPASRPLIEETAGRARMVLVLEPPLPGGAAKTARKGACTYELRVMGRAAHAGIEPERGVSATHELARQLLKVLALADGSRGTTVNVGLIGGGSAANVVASDAWAYIDTRFVTMDEQRRLDADLRALTPEDPKARISVKRLEQRPPLERDQGVLELYEHARSLAGQIGFDLPEGSTGGGSDGCLTAALGVPTLDGLGVDGGGAHAAHEHIVIADLPRRVALLRRLLETL